MTKMMPVSAWQFAIFMVLVAGVVAVSTSPSINSFKWSDWAGSVGVEYQPRYVPVSTRAEAAKKGSRFWGMSFPPPPAPVVTADSVSALEGRAHEGDVMVRPQETQSGDVPALEAVRAFYDGDLDPVMTVPVDLHGTEGQQAGWAALRRIRPGSPLTYTEFARELGNPRAVRAAASVCARNPVALFVPCHRVLRSDGSMGGFAWGEAIKRDLLRREARSAA